MTPGWSNPGQRNGREIRMILFFKRTDSRVLAFFLAVLAGLMVGWEDDLHQGDDEGMGARQHVAYAALLEGDRESLHQALDEYEKAWEKASELTDEERWNVIRAVSRLRGVINRPPVKKPPVTWNVLGVAYFGINCRLGTHLVGFQADRETIPNLSRMRRKRK